MKKLLLLFFVVLNFNVYAQEEEKDLRYYYYSANLDADFNDYLIARKVFDVRKFDFKLPASPEFFADLKKSESKVFKNERTYAEFLNKYGMKNAGEYAELWFSQMVSLKKFIKKNPEFYNLTTEQRQSVIDKWYYSTVASN
jgi:hypothetical protein